MKPPKTLTYEETVKLLNWFSTQYTTPIAIRRAVRNYAMTLIMLDAGLRVSEVTKLIISDLFIQGEPVTTLMVRKTIAKRKHERLIPLTKRLRLQIDQMHKIVWSVHAHYPTDYAFGRVCSRVALTPRQVQRMLAGASFESIGRAIHPHVLRHTFATRLMRLTSTPVVQELLGHTHLSSTQIYTHPNEDDKKKAIDLLGGPKPNKISQQT